MNTKLERQTSDLSNATVEQTHLLVVSQEVVQWQVRVPLDLMDDRLDHATLKQVVQLGFGEVGNA